MAIYLIGLKMFCVVIGFVLAIVGSADSFNLDRSSTDMHESMKDVSHPPLVSEQKHYIPHEAFKDYNGNQRSNGTGTEDVFIDPKVLENIFGGNPNPSMLKTDSRSSTSNSKEKDTTTRINNTDLDLEVIWPGAPSHNHKYDTAVKYGGNDDQSRSNPEMQNMVRNTSESLTPSPQSMAGPDDNSNANNTLPDFDTDNRFLSENLLTQAFGNSLEDEVKKRNAIIVRSTKELAATEPVLRNAEHENHILVLPTSHKDHTLTPLSNHSSSNYASSLILIVISLCIFPHQYN